MSSLFRAGGLQPASVIVVGGTLILLVGRKINGFESAPWMISLVVLLSMTYHLVAYERGRDQAGTDFAVTLAGVLYIGWLGAYFISLRNLHRRQMVDPGCPSSGLVCRFGCIFHREKIWSPPALPTLEPQENLGGLPGRDHCQCAVDHALCCLMAGWEPVQNSAITPLRGALMGLVMGIFPTLGDLGESMIKRQIGVKDSGNILPGHGGAFDRVDSWLWAVVIGYYMILWLWI